MVSVQKFHIQSAPWPTYQQSTRSIEYVGAAWCRAMPACTHQESRVHTLLLFPNAPTHPHSLQAGETVGLGAVPAVSDWDERAVSVQSMIGKLARISAKRRQWSPRPHSWLMSIIPHTEIPPAAARPWALSVVVSAWLGNGDCLGCEEEITFSGVRQRSTLAPRFPLTANQSPRLYAFDFILKHEPPNLLRSRTLSSCDPAELTTGTLEARKARNAFHLRRSSGACSCRDGHCR